MKNSSYPIYWFFWFAICSVSYQHVQDNIRPNYNGENQIIIYLLGIAPNFFPGIGLPAILYILLPEIFKNNRDKKWLRENRHRTVNLISRTGLIGWEFIQMSGSLRFDWNDILWTLIGAGIFQLIWIFTPERFKV